MKIPLIHYAIRQKASNDCLKVLLDKGADPNVRLQSTGATPLLVAIQAKKNEAVQILLDHGSDPNITNLKGEIPLFHAIHIDNREALQMLLEHGSVFDVGKKLALHFAARQSRGLCCQILLSYNADRDKVDHKGKTAFAIAYEKEDPLCELILGSNVVPSGSNEIELIYELNEQIKKDYADLWSEWDSHQKPSNDDKFRQFLQVISANERRMKRFSQFVSFQKEVIEKDLNKMLQALQTKDNELEKLKQDLLDTWNAKLQQSLELQSHIQKDLYTPNGSESLHRWNEAVKERMKFMTDLIARSNESNEEVMNEYTNLKSEFEKIKRLHDSHQKKTLSFDKKIRGFLENLQNFGNETTQRQIERLLLQIDSNNELDSRSTLSSSQKRYSRSSTAKIE